MCVREREPVWVSLTQDGTPESLIVKFLDFAAASPSPLNGTFSFTCQILGSSRWVLGPSAAIPG